MTDFLTLHGGTWLVVLAVILVSGWVHGALGLGFPLLATPALATIMDVRSAILVTLLPTMAVNIASIANHRGRLEETRQYGPLILFILLGSLLGTSILAIADPEPFRLLLAALILLFLWGKVRIRATTISNRPLAVMAITGLAAGMAAGITNVMVAILIIYFLALGTARDVMVPAMNACFLVGKAAQILVLALAGLVSLGLLLETAPLALGAVLALQLGQRAQAGLPAESYQSLLRGLLLLLALILLWQFFAGYFA
ncbi:MAG: TSUP family transporter [Lysobacterales bacterium]